MLPLMDITAQQATWSCIISNQQHPGAERFVVSFQSPAVRLDFLDYTQRPINLFVTGQWLASYGAGAACFAGCRDHSHSQDSRRYARSRLPHLMPFCLRDAHIKTSCSHNSIASSLRPMHAPLLVYCLSVVYASKLRNGLFCCCLSNTAKQSFRSLCFVVRCVGWSHPSIQSRSETTGINNTTRNSGLERSLLQTWKSAARQSYVDSSRSFNHQQRKWKVRNVESFLDDGIQHKSDDWQEGTITTRKPPCIYTATYNHKPPSPPWKAGLWR